MGSLTKALIGKEDCDVATSGTYETFSRLNSVGSTITMTSFPDIWKSATDMVNAKYYGAHDATGATLNGSVGQSASNSCKDIYIEGGAWVISTDYDWSSYTTVRWIFGSGAYLSIAAGCIVTFPSPASIIASPNQQIFSGAGTVAFSRGGTVYSEWWGDTVSAFQSACSTGQIVSLSNKTYTISPTISTACTILGLGEGSYISGNITLAADNIVLQSLRCKRIITAAVRDNIKIRNCVVDPVLEAGASIHAIFFTYPCSNLEITNCEVRNSEDSGIVMIADTRAPRNDAAVSNLAIINNYIHDCGGAGINVGANKDGADSDSALFVKVLIANNRIIDIGTTTANHAIYIHSMENFNVSNNVIDTITGDFISLGHAQTSAHATMDDGVVCGNSCFSGGHYGITVQNCKAVSITGNSLISSGTNGIRFYGGPTWGSYGVTIAGNTIKGFTANGGITLDAGQTDIDINNNIIDAETPGSDLYGVFLLQSGVTPATVLNLSINNNVIRNAGGFYMQGAVGFEVTLDGLSYRGNKSSGSLNVRGFHMDATFMTITNVIITDNYFQHSSNSHRVTFPSRLANVTIQNNFITTSLGNFRLNDYVAGNAIAYGTVAAGALDATREPDFVDTIGDKLIYTDPTSGGYIGKIMTGVTGYKSFGAILP